MYFRVYLIFLSLIAGGCSDQLSPDEYSCKTLSQSYQKVLQPDTKNPKVYSWETLKEHHKKILPQLIENWPRLKAVKDSFSLMYFSLLKPRIDLACGTEVVQEKKIDRPVQKGIVKTVSTIIPSPFSTCLNKEYSLSHRFIFQACLIHIKKK